MKKKPRGKPFERGHTKSKGKNPKKSRPQYDIEELAGKIIDQKFINRHLTINSHLTEKELRKRLEDPKISILEKRIVKSLIGEDDAMPFGEIINRLAGKVPDKIIHDTVASKKYAHMTNEELLAEKIRLSEINRITLDRLAKEKQEQEARLLESASHSSDVAIDVEAKEIPD